jgi:tRNA/tmRNA/rRNA uracil-C5-methylase (TrmA/RlmC/RlmD family)
MTTAGSRPGSAVGTSFAVDVGPVAHGGHCVARHDNRVVFVRHALPGERVRVTVTEGDATSKFWRADAVEILSASPDRVTPPCPWARPGLCGGCDWQHASLDAQRQLKSDVVREQLQRLAGIRRNVVVEAVVGAHDGTAEGLGWRTRVRYAVDDAGRAGLRRHRSRDVVPIDWCRIAHPLVVEADVPARAWPPDTSVSVVAAVATGERLVLNQVGDKSHQHDDEVVTEQVGERTFQVHADGFWQVHPAAAAVLVDAVLVGLDPQPGESALDLYCGVGLFAAAIAPRLGAAGRITAVEADRAAARDAVTNLTDFSTVRVERGRVDQVLGRLRLRRADLVVLDPPRSGAGRAVVDLVSRVQARRIAYVACDPAALARDLRWFAERGYELLDLRAFDLFPMTQHVECVAVLERRGATVS